MLEGWVHFWFRGELLSVPAELRGEHDALVAQLNRVKAENAALVEWIQRLEAELDQRARLQEQQRRVDTLLRIFRSLIEPKARQQGRQDILAQYLP